MGKKVYYVQYHKIKHLVISIKIWLYVTLIKVMLFPFFPPGI